MITKCQEVALKLLDEIDALCASNNLSYFLTGEYANAACRGGAFLSQSAAPRVLMTLPDIERLSAALEKSKPADRVLESLGNNGELDSLCFFYCATDTLFVKLNETSKRKTAGISVRIVPLMTQLDDARALAGTYCEQRWLFENKKVKEKPTTEVEGFFAKRAVRKAAEKMDALLKGDRAECARFVLGTACKGQRNLQLSQALYVDKGKGLRREFPAGLFASSKRVELEGHAYRVPKDTEAFMRAVYEGDGWRDRVFSSEEFGNYTLMSADLPYECYFGQVEHEGLQMVAKSDIAAVKRFKKQDKELLGGIARSWNAVKRTAARFELAEELLPQKGKIVALAARKEFNELGELLAAYDEQARTLVELGYGLCFDEEILACYLQLLRSRGEADLAARIDALVPAQDRKTLEL